MLRVDKFQHDDEDEDANDDDDELVCRSAGCRVPSAAGVAGASRQMMGAWEYHIDEIS